MAKIKYIVMHAVDTFAPLFWNDEDVGIGDGGFGPSQLPPRVATH